MSRRLVASILVLVPVSATALAQGVQPLNGSYRYGSLGNYFGGPCPTAAPGFVADHGTLTFAANGTLAMTTNVYDVCSGGLVLTAVENGTGTYAVATDGTVLLDFDPQNPGTDTARLFLRGDGSVGLHALDHAEDESSLAVIVKMSSGRGNFHLTGPYHVVRQTFTNVVGVSAVCDLGVMVCDGAGSYSESGSRRSLSAVGALSAAPYAGAGAYTVAADGTLTVGTGIGALSADGELFYYVTTNGPSGALTVGVRAGSGLSAADFVGPWGICALGYEHASVTQPRWVTDFYRPVVAAAGASSGTLSGLDLEVEIDWQGATLVSQTLAGQYTIAPDGSLAFAFGGTPVPAALSANGTFLVGRTVDPGRSGLLVGLRRCGWPGAYGTATAGSGAQAPSLAAAGGFPFPGNNSFGLAIGNGVGSGFTLVAFSFGQAPGLPLFGGLVWVDPTAILGTLGLLLSGAPGAPGAGAATLAFPLPPVPALRGVQFYVQAGVLDPGAPQGVALTPGLDLRLCR